MSNIARTHNWTCGEATYRVVCRGRTCSCYCNSFLNTVVPVHTVSCKLQENFTCNAQLCPLTECMDVERDQYHVLVCWRGTTVRCTMVRNIVRKRRRRKNSTSLRGRCVRGGDWETRTGTVNNLSYYYVSHIHLTKSVLKCCEVHSFTFAWLLWAADRDMAFMLHSSAWSIAHNCVVANVPCRTVEQCSNVGLLSDSTLKQRLHAWASMRTHANEGRKEDYLGAI